MELHTDINYVKGVGPAVAEKLRILGINTVSDLLSYYPRRYEDYSNVLPINAIKPGKVSIKVTIKQAKGHYVRGGLHITEAAASDETGSVKLVWFNQPYREKAIVHGASYFVSGLFEFRSGRLSITNPSMELESAFPLNTARLVPIYRETKGLKSAQIRKFIKIAFDLIPKLPETLPNTVIKKYKLIDRREALWSKHFPVTTDAIEVANHRLGFEELFEIVLASMFARQTIDSEDSMIIPFDELVAKQFVEHLPFDLTGSQRKATWQIFTDLANKKPMNRLLEGDVGAGKTVVAAMAAVMVIAKGKQVSFMAPTELLARQHAETLYRLLEPLGMAEKVCLLVGGMKPSDKKRAHQHVAEGEAQLLVGTHALIQEKVDMKELALVIVDEQHRFGVEQRKRLLSKAGHAPHMLSMTATPIPRSLALTVFGEVDISILDEKPKDRKPIVTTLVNPTDTLKIYDKVESELSNGRQAFVVCPLIEDSDVLKAKSAEATYKELKTKFRKRRVDLLHGKMKAEDKQRIMQAFVDGTTDILVATTVIEVGVDVPNATIMLIQAPERFGLAQLHQLRGRVGRSEHQGHCYLMLSDSVSPSRRLRAIEASQDGFKLAQLDLEIRGAGALYGTSQHGQLDLRIADFTDSKLIAAAREAAKSFIDDPDNLVQYPYIKKRIMELQTVVHLN